jgi:hypothetical protein
MKLSELEKLALEFAELAGREGKLSAESKRIASELAEVSAAKADALRRLAGANGENGNGSRQKPQDAGAKERVLQMLTSNPSHVFGSAEVVTKLGLTRGTASVYLSELAKEQRIARVGNGRYQGIQQGSHHRSTAVSPTSSTATAAPLPERIQTLFASEPGVAFDAPTIGVRFGTTDATTVNSIRGALSRLSRDGKIEKVNRGGYRAASGFKVDMTFSKGDAQPR